MTGESCCMSQLSGSPILERFGDEDVVGASIANYPRGARSPKPFSTSSLWPFSGIVLQKWNYRINFPNHNDVSSVIGA
jgi:hypothetical protein